MASLSQEQQMQLLAELEIEMMSDMYNRMTTACQKKCVPPTYRDGDLSKGESVCLDRCVAKYLEVHESLGKKLTEKSMQDEAMMKQMNPPGGNSQPSWYALLDGTDVALNHEARTLVRIATIKTDLEEII